MGKNKLIEIVGKLITFGKKTIVSAFTLATVCDVMVSVGVFVAATRSA